MIDAEMVRRALSLCRYDPDPGMEPKVEHSCKKCPYYRDGDMYCANMYTDAILFVDEGRASIERAQRMYHGFGKWKELKGDYMSPGGTPAYVCAKCGGGEHLFGVEYQWRRMVCPDYKSINSYPWERTYEEKVEA